MTGRALGSAVPLALALVLLVASVVAPIGALLVTSLRVTSVDVPGGTFVAAGDVAELDGKVTFRARGETEPGQTLTLDASRVRVRREWSLDHYRAVWGSPRTRALVWSSSKMAAAGTLLALLLGIPAGFLVARTTLPGRRLLAVLFAGVLVVPPFFVAMSLASGGGAWVSLGGLLRTLGFSGRPLQAALAATCFALLYYPVVALLAGRAMRNVPAGLAESARLLSGRRGAWLHVSVPFVLPSALAAGVLIFVLCLSDLAIPDLLGVFLDPNAAGMPAFATELLLQWQSGNTARAVATGAPFFALMLAGVALSVWVARRGPAGVLGGSHRPRPRVALRPLGTAVGWTFAAVLVAASLLMPISAVGSWGFSPARIPTSWAQTEKIGADTARWLRMGVAAALLATAAAVVLARFVVRGGATARTVATALVLLPLAAPGTVVSAGTSLVWAGTPWAGEGILRPVLALTARVFPYAFFAAWLALREVDRGLEDAARLAGARTATRALRVWGPLSAGGVLAAFALALVFALREYDALVFLEKQTLPGRIYDKVHFSRTGQVADLSMLLLGILLLPGLLAAALLSRRRRPPPDVQ